MLDPADARPQWNTYTCGPSALRTALLCYGDRIDQKRLAKMANTTWWGTEADEMGEALNEFGLRIDRVVFCTRKSAWRTTMRETYAACLSWLQQKTPLLLCVENDDHWIVAVRGRARSVDIVDPAFDEGSNYQRVTWRFLLRRMHQGLPDEMKFVVYPVVLA